MPQDEYRSLDQQIDRLSKLVNSRERAQELAALALEEQIAIAASFKIMATNMVAADDPVYRFDATDKQLLDFLTDPVKVLSAMGVTIPSKDLIVIGRFAPLGGPFARIYGVPGTKIAMVIVESKLTIGPSPVLPSQLTAEEVSFDYVKTPAGGLSDRVFFHQQITNQSRKALDAYGNWVPDSLKVTRAETANLAFNMILNPINYLSTVPMTYASTTADRKYSDISWNQSTPPTRKKLSDPLTWVTAPDARRLARGFVLELQSADANMCAVSEFENKHIADPPGSGRTQLFLPEQLIIKCY